MFLVTFKTNFGVMLASFSHQKCHATKRHNKNKQKEQTKKTNKQKTHTKQRTQQSSKCKQGSQHYRTGLQMQTWFATLPKRVANVNRVRNITTTMYQMQTKFETSTKGSCSFRPVLNQVTESALVALATRAGVVVISEFTSVRLNVLTSKRPYV